VVSPGAISLVILPGLDGTGLLLSSLGSALSADMKVAVIEYPVDVALGYDQLADYVMQRLPHGDFVLIGESFSGPLALRIAAQTPPGIKGVVLGASFARLDWPFKKLLSAVAGIVSPRAVPTVALAFVLLGGWADSKNIKMLRAALAKVKPEVLRARAREALAVDIVGETEKVKPPILFLQASHDRLVPRAAATAVAQIACELRIETMEAPHFLFQVAPVACASAIRRFCSQLK
jgi:pimeloyl-[acyl-carrier protein] methyl ester esterase